MPRRARIAPATVSPAPEPSRTPPAGGRRGSTPAAPPDGPPLGGLTPAAFVRRHWQQRPLLIRRAIDPGQLPPLDRRTLFALAARDDVESRLVVRDAARWSLAHGPFTPRALPPLRQPRWTLLVQGVDLQLQAVHELMARFRFVPDARLDDCMVSFATDGGGVGPHVDSYDVFLLQLHGQRRWSVGPVESPPRLRPGLPLRILRGFEPSDVWLLQPGDLLYLPPGWGHDGVAVGECLTCSIGFRAPEAGELAGELLQRWLAEREPARRRRLYRDPADASTATPARIPASLQHFAAASVDALLADRAALSAELLLGLGEWLTEPKAHTVFEPAAHSRGPRSGPLRLDRRTRMMYDARHLFLNGEALRVSGTDRVVLRRLADRRELAIDDVRRLSPPAREAVAAWVRHGWAHWMGTGERRDAVR